MYNYRYNSFQIYWASFWLSGLSGPVRGVQSKQWRADKDHYDVREVRVFYKQFPLRICIQRTHFHKNRLWLMLYLCTRSQFSKAKGNLPENFLLRCVTVHESRSLRSKSVTLFRCSTVVRTMFFICVVQWDRSIWIFAYYIRIYLLNI